MKLIQTKEDLLKMLKRNAEVLEKTNIDVEWFVGAEIRAIENIDLDPLGEGFEYTTRLALNRNAIEIIKRKPIWNGEYWEFADEQVVKTVAI